MQPPWAIDSWKQLVRHASAQESALVEPALAGIARVAKASFLHYWQCDTDRNMQELRRRRLRCAAPVETPHPA